MSLQGCRWVSWCCCSSCTRRRLPVPRSSCRKTRPRLSLNSQRTHTTHPGYDGNTCTACRVRVCARACVGLYAAAHSHDGLGHGVPEAAHHRSRLCQGRPLPVRGHHLGRLCRRPHRYVPLIATATAFASLVTHRRRADAFTCDQACARSATRSRSTSVSRAAPTGRMSRRPSCGRGPSVRPRARLLPLFSFSSLAHAGSQRSALRPTRGRVFGA